VSREDAPIINVKPWRKIAKTCLYGTYTTAQAHGGGQSMTGNLGHRICTFAFVGNRCTYRHCDKLEFPVCKKAPTLKDPHEG
jgi:hypothetical protein